MSTPVPVTVPMLVTAAVAPNTNPTVSAGVSVVITDSTGVAQPAVLLTGAEQPTPWAYTANVAAGPGTGVATAVDANNVPVVGASPVTQSFVATPPVQTAQGFVPTALNFGPAPTPAPTVASAVRRV